MNETLDGLEARDADHITDDFESSIDDWYEHCPDRTPDMNTGRAMELEIEKLHISIPVTGENYA